MEDGIGTILRVFMSTDAVSAGVAIRGVSYSILFVLAKISILSPIMI